MVSDCSEKQRLSFAHQPEAHQHAGEGRATTLSVPPREGEMKGPSLSGQQLTDSPRIQADIHSVRYSKGQAAERVLPGTWHIHLRVV